MGKSVFVIFVFQFLLLTMMAQKPDIKFDNVDKDDGLSNNIVKAVIQDTYGFLWFGTKNGLNRFNGSGFDVFYHDIENPKSLPDNYVTTLADKDDSTLIVGTYGGHLSLFNKYSETFDNSLNTLLFEHDIVSYPVSKIYADSSSTVWFSTLGAGLVKLNVADKTLESFNVLNCNLSSDIISDFEIDAQGNFWLATQGRFINVFNTHDNSVAYILHDELLSDARISFGKQLYIDDDNGIWAGTESRGLYKYDKKLNRFNGVYNTQNSQLASNFITSITGDSKYIYLATDGGGVYLLDRVSLDLHAYTFDDKNKYSISTNAIWSLFISKEKILWVGTFAKGVDFVEPQKTLIKTVSRRLYAGNTIDNKSVLSICALKDSSILLGTDGYGMFRYNLKDNTVEEIISFDDKQSCPKVVKSIFEDSKGTVWVGSYANGLYVANKKAVREKSIIDSLKNKSIWDIFEDSRGNLWFGTLYSGVYKYSIESNTIKHFVNDKTNSSLSSNTINVIFEDSDKNIWIGTESGGVNLYNEENHTFSVLKSDVANSYSLRCNTVRTINQDSKGNVWFGTATGGLSRLLNFRTNTFIHFNISTNFVSNTISDIVVDKFDNLWISTDKGICKMDVLSESINLIDENYGLPSTNFNYNNALLYNGEIYFGSMEGVCIVPQKRLKFNTKMPSIYIKTLKIKNRNINPKEKYDGRIILDKPMYATSDLNLLFEDNIILFEVALLHFSNSKNIYYTYMLEGFDKGWNHSSINQQYINYSNLKGGMYTLRLIPFNSDGTEGKETKLHINVKPAYYSTIWFKIILVFLIFCIFSSVVYILIFIQRKKRRSLEKIIEEKIQCIVKHETMIDEQQKRLEKINNALANQKEEVQNQKNLLVSSNDENMLLNKNNAILNEQLGRVNNMVNTQNIAIRKYEKNNSLLEYSQNFARKIQHYIFQSEEKLVAFYPNSFLISLPKNIVGGDFLWMKKIENLTFLALADCPGQSISGAIMSLMGNMLLNDIVENQKERTPSVILLRLDEIFHEIFERENLDAEISDEGIDMTICVFDSVKNTVMLASALQHVFIAKNGEIEILKGDIFSIGGLMSKCKKAVYLDKEVSVTQGLRLFFASDGIIDQIGGNRREKFGVEKIKEMLQGEQSDITQLSKIVTNTVLDWKQDNDQMDDILFCGIEF